MQVKPNFQMLLKQVLVRICILCRPASHWCHLICSIETQCSLTQICQHEKHHRAFGRKQCEPINTHNCPLCTAAATSPGSFSIFHNYCNNGQSKQHGSSYSQCQGPHSVSFGIKGKRHSAFSEVTQNEGNPEGKIHNDLDDTV